MALSKNGFDYTSPDLLMPMPVQLTEQALAFQCEVVLRGSLLTLEIENLCVKVRCTYFRVIRSIVK